MPCCCTNFVGDLARDHARRLAAVARREGLSPADALDAVQEAFQTLLVRTDLHARAPGVLYTLTRNAARNLRRRHHRARPHDDLDVATAAAPGDVLEREKLGACMAKLGDVHRHVITLRVLEELSGAEAAEALGVTPNHVGVLLHRARKELEACMVTARQ